MASRVEVLMGGAEVIALSGGGLHQLHAHRLLFVDTSSPGGIADIRLPSAKGLPLGSTRYKIIFATTSIVDFRIKDRGDNILNIFDRNQDLRSLIDVSITAQWSTQPAIECTLLVASTNNGVWINRFWGET